MYEASLWSSFLGIWTLKRVSYQWFSPIILNMLIHPISFKFMLQALLVIMLNKAVCSLNWKTEIVKSFKQQRANPLLHFLFNTSDLCFERHCFIACKHVIHIRHSQQNLIHQHANWEKQNLEIMTWQHFLRAMTDSRCFSSFLRVSRCRNCLNQIKQLDKPIEPCTYIPLLP